MAEKYKTSEKDYKEHPKKSTRTFKADLQSSREGVSAKWRMNVTEFDLEQLGKPADIIAAYTLLSEQILFPFFSLDCRIKIHVMVLFGVGLHNNIPNFTKYFWKKPARGVISWLTCDQNLLITFCFQR